MNEVPTISPPVEKAGLDLLLWCDDENVFVEHISADAKDHAVDSGAEADHDTWIFGIGIPLEIYLMSIPSRFTYGMVQEDGEVARITPDPLH